MRNHWPLLRLIFCVAILVPRIATRADAKEDAGLGDKVQIQSTVLKESRSLIVHKPPSYEEGSERYPVLYLLDGQDFFQFTTSITDFLAANDRTPEMIVVAIDSGQFAHRTHDLTPASQSEIDNRFNPGNGGADTFLSFISDELMPYVEKNYRTRPYKVLAGHSLGGLFAVHALVTKPQLFNAYIAIDPSLSWNDEEEVAKAELFFKKTKHLQADLFLAAANMYGSSIPGIQRFVAVLDEKAPEGFRWNFNWMKDETHGSIPLLGIYTGLDTIFDDWHIANPLPLYDAGGIEAIQKHVRDGGRRYGYDRVVSPFTVSLLVAGLIKTGRLDEAGTVLQYDQRNYPAPWNQLEALARNYADRGDREKAVHYYQLSLKANPANKIAKQKLKEMGVAVDPAQPDQSK